MPRNDVVDFKGQGAYRRRSRSRSQSKGRSAGKLAAVIAKTRDPRKLMKIGHALGQAARAAKSPAAKKKAAVLLGVAAAKAKTMGFHGRGDFMDWLGKLGDSVGNIPIALANGATMAAQMAPAIALNSLANMGGRGAYHTKKGRKRSRSRSKSASRGRKRSRSRSKSAGRKRIRGRGAYMTAGEVAPGLRTNEIVDPGSNFARAPAKLYTPESETATLIVEHREYLGDVIAPPDPSGLSIDTLFLFNINPGLAKSFPLLSRFAALFEEYQMIQLIFRLKSIVAPGNNDAQGTWTAAVIYNPSGPAFATKQSMDNAEFSVSNPINYPMDLGVECDPKKNAISGTLYTRYSELPSGSDKNTYDMGRIQVATSNTPKVSGDDPERPGFPVGELWVFYKCKLSKLRTSSQPPLDVGEGASWEVYAPTTTGAVCGAAANIMLGVPTPVSTVGATVKWADAGSPAQFPMPGWPSPMFPVGTGSVTTLAPLKIGTVFLTNASGAGEAVLMYYQSKCTATTPTFDVDFYFQINALANTSYQVQIAVSGINPVNGSSAVPNMAASLTLPTLECTSGATVTKLNAAWIAPDGSALGTVGAAPSNVIFGWTIVAGTTGGQNVLKLHWPSNVTTGATTIGFVNYVAVSLLRVS